MAFPASAGTHTIDQPVDIREDGLAWFAGSAAKPPPLPCLSEAEAANLLKMHGHNEM